MKRYIRSAIIPLSKVDVDSKMDIANSPNTPPEVLDELFHSTHSANVRMAVLANPNAPVSLLEECINEGLYEEVALRNPNIPVKYLKQFSHSRIYGILISVAQNPNTPPEVLKDMAFGEYNLVNRYIAANPNTPIDVLTDYSHFDDNYIRWNALHNPSATEEMHQRFNEEFNWQMALYIDIEVPNNGLDDKVIDDAFHSLCDKYGVVYLGYDLEDVTKSYYITNGDIWQYQGRCEYIFDTHYGALDPKSSIRDDIFRILDREGYVVTDMTWMELDTTFQKGGV